jgi:hypothetical protein
MILCINHDFCTEPINVRCWMNSGKQMLASSFSGFDPTETLAAPNRNALMPWSGRPLRERPENLHHGCPLAHPAMLRAGPIEAMPGRIAPA